MIKHGKTCVTPWYNNDKNISNYPLNISVSKHLLLKQLYADRFILTKILVKLIFKKFGYKRLFATNPKKPVFRITHQDEQNIYM